MFKPQQGFWCSEGGFTERGESNWERVMLLSSKQHQIETFLLLYHILHFKYICNCETFVPLHYACLCTVGMQSSSPGTAGLNRANHDLLLFPWRPTASKRFKNWFPHSSRLQVLPSSSYSAHSRILCRHSPLLRAEETFYQLCEACHALLTEGTNGLSPIDLGFLLLD